MNRFGEIFNQIAKTLSCNVGEIFILTSKNMINTSIKEAWEEAINIANLNINKEDKNILKELGNLLRTNRCRRTS